MKFHSLSYSDKKLEQLSKEQLDQRGKAPWFEFISEIYSLGKTFRESYNFPNRLCLPISSDHGVNIQPTYDEYERSTKGPYFTWNKRKLKKILSTNREAYLVQHPWVSYKNKIKFKRSSKNKGTLVFFPKSIQALKLDRKFIKNYMRLLKKLPKECKPITICLFYYDINQKLHKELRKYNFPLVTAGNSSSVYFVDRFYKLISNFRYATSPLGGRPGSYFYFCIDALVPFFFYGRNLEYYSDENKFFKKGKVKIHQIFSQKYSSKKEYKNMLKITKNFNQINKTVSKKQLKIVREYLGYSSKLSKKRINYILWKSFVKNIFDIIKIYYYALKSTKLKKS